MELKNVGDKAPLGDTPIAHDIEISNVIVHHPEGPEHCCRWRYHVQIPTLPGQEMQLATTPWVIASRRAIEDMLAKWRKYLDEGTFGDGSALQ